MSSIAATKFLVALLGVTAATAGAFVITVDAPQPIDNPVTVNALAADVNAAGTIVGQGYTLDLETGAITRSAALRSTTGSAAAELEVPATLTDASGTYCVSSPQATAVSEDNAVVGMVRVALVAEDGGCAPDVAMRAARWDPSGHFQILQPEPSSPGRVFSDAEGISQNGRFAIGMASFAADGALHSTRWDGTVATALADFCDNAGSCDYGFATRINDDGIAAGRALAGSHYVAVRWRADGTAEELPLPSDMSYIEFGSVSIFRVAPNGDVYGSVYGVRTIDGSQQPVRDVAIRWPLGGGADVLPVPNVDGLQSPVAANSAGMVLYRCFSTIDCGEILTDGSAYATVVPTSATNVSGLSELTDARAFLAGTQSGAFQQMIRTTATITTVTNPPIVQSVESPSATEGSTVTIGATVTGGIAPVVYEWDLDGDGTFETRTLDPRVDFVAVDEGSFVVRLRAKDAIGLTSDVGQATVLVSDVAPAVDPGAPIRGDIGRSVTLAASFRDPGTADGPWSYSVSWGDGSDASTGDLPSTGAPIAPTHSYAIPGDHEATITVADRHGITGSATVAIAVVNHVPVANAGADRSGAEGSTIAFDASSSTDDDNDALTYSWTFGDGTSEAGVAPSHVYSDNGSYQATVTVTDPYGAFSTATVTVAVSDVAPAVNAGEPIRSAVGRTVTLGASFSDPGTADGPWSYSVDWGDGSSADTGPLSSIETPIAPSHRYTKPGAYQSTITVADRHAITGSATIEISIVNHAPVANAGSDRSGTEGSAIAFDATASSDDDGDALEYVWTFGDGTSGTGVEPTHVYADNGSYRATLTVTDAYGAFSTATATVTVSDVAPSVNAGEPIRSAVGRSVTLGASFGDPGTADGPWRYSVSWGDGSAASTGDLQTTSTPIAPTHVYATAGNREATITVADRHGITGTATVAIAIVNHVPVANAGGDRSGAEGSAIAFDASASSDEDGDALSYAWTFGDGTSGTGAAPTHTYADNGSYQARVTVTDLYGGSAAAAVTVTITNVAPTVGPISGAPIDPIEAGSPVTLTASFTDPGLGDTHTGSVRWNFTQAFVAADMTRSPTANAPGTISTSATLAAGVYTATLRVRDDDGGEGTTTTSPDYIVVFDPEGGFVTGGGWINSPVGACRLTSACGTVTGKATFGFVSRYLNGANKATGNTEFKFQAGNFRFSSTSYDWLVVNSFRAQYRGSGTVNGVDGYSFLLSAIDGDLKNGGGADLFRIRILDAAGTVVYDNEIKQSENADPTTTLGGGSIQIHKS